MAMREGAVLESCRKKQQRRGDSVGRGEGGQRLKQEEGGLKGAWGAWGGVVRPGGAVPVPQKAAPYPRLGDISSPLAFLERWEILSFQPATGFVIWQRNFKKTKPTTQSTSSQSVTAHAFSTLLQSPAESQLSSVIFAHLPSSAWKEPSVVSYRGISRSQLPKGN